MRYVNLKILLFFVCFFYTLWRLLDRTQAKNKKCYLFDQKLSSLTPPSIMWYVLPITTTFFYVAPNLAVLYIRLSLVSVLLLLRLAPQDACRQRLITPAKKKYTIQHWKLIKIIVNKRDHCNARACCRCDEARMEYLNEKLSTGEKVEVSYNIYTYKIY